MSEDQQPDTIQHVDANGDIQWLKIKDIPVDRVIWHSHSMLQNFGVSRICIGSFTLHIEPDGSLRGEGNADGAAQSFLDNVVALHNAKLHDLRAENQRLQEALAIAQKPA